MSSEEQAHEPNCIFIRAKKLIDEEIKSIKLIVHGGYPDMSAAEMEAQARKILESTFGLELVYLWEKTPHLTGRPRFLLRHKQEE